MAIEIYEESMTAEFKGAVIATAARIGGRWSVSAWPQRLTYNQAITALTLAERLAAGYGDDDPFARGGRNWPVVDRIIRATTALAVIAVAGVAAIISYRHAYELVRSHGETGATARLVPLTVDGLIWAASMVILDSNRRTRPVPALAGWSLGIGVVATVGANMAHGMGHGVIGLLVSAWPALALVGAYELLMSLIRAERAVPAGPGLADAEIAAAPTGTEGTPPEPADAPTLEQLVRARYEVGASQRAIARDLKIDRRKVKHIIDQPA